MDKVLKTVRSDFRFMKTALLIDLSVSIPVSYEKKFISAIKDQVPEIQTLDLDSGSESILFSYAVRMLKESEKYVIAIKAEKTSITKNVYELADILVKNKERSLVYFEGENPILEKMLSVLKDNFFKNSGLQNFISVSVDFLREN